jgi:ribonuclease I
MIKNIYDTICDMIWGPDPVDTRFYYLSLLKNAEYDELEFSIHGLWPQNSKTSFPSYCKKVVFSIEKLVPILPDLKKYWYSDREKNVDFWKHEYVKHGSCVFTPMNEYQYFKKALDLYHKAIKLNLPEKYASTDSYNVLIPVSLDFEFFEEL